MTGFGRGEAAVSGGSAAAEVRCVNSRHLDVRVRLPRDLVALEAAVRGRAAAAFARGQVEVAVRLSREVAPGGRVELDRAAASQYARAAAELGAQLGIAGQLDLAALLALPGVARVREDELDVDVLSGGVLLAVERACAEAAQMRAREGAALERELRARLAEVGERLGRLEALARQAAGSQRERLTKRLAALAPELELETGRFEQEVVLQVERMDVTEELVRLRSHCEQFGEALAAAGPIGRKLEFLLQELAREANTAGSKAADAELAREVVELKLELEKLREQVSNVE
jgi:uncharacterized protein (TIGR00255 family)